MSISNSNVKIIIKEQFNGLIPPLTIRAKHIQRAGYIRPIHLGTWCVYIHPIGVTYRLEFTFALPQGSCRQFSEPFISHDITWLLIIHCLQTVAPDH